MVLLDFDAYQKFRDELLEMGYGLQCNVSRINAIQSPMMGYSEEQLKFEQQWYDSI